MEMRGAEDTDMGGDLTPPLPPLAFCLHRPFIATLCSACSLPLPPDPVHAHSLLYCSGHHSSLHSEQNLHHSSGVRLANLLFRNNRAGAPDLTRIGGLLTNYEKIIAREEDDEVLHMVKEGAAAMIQDDAPLAEAFMCLVLTNAVEVQDKNGSNVGIAVYDPTFSWINHSCSPNACYRFTTTMADVTDGDSQLRIRPNMVAGVGGAARASDRKRSQGCGPRIIVRSIKGIKKDEEVTIAYTDLLQPKELRQSELLSKYQFNCCCKRCQAPATYVDRNIQAVYICGPNGNELISDDDFFKTTEAQKLMDAFDDAVDEYLQFNNPETCCTKLDELLTHGHKRSEPFIRLHQFHHLSLSAYTTLASAYRVRASDLMVNSTPEKCPEDFNMSRASVAYSLLLAVFTHHLFRAEPSLIASAANHWRNAGESMIRLSRNLQPSNPVTNLLGTSHKCYQILRPDGFDEKYFTGEKFAEVSSQLSNCIVNLAEKMWSLLTDQQVCHLSKIKNLVDFRGLLVVVSPTPDVSGIGDTEHDNVHLFHLGFHCLIFGMYLSIACFGKQYADDIIVSIFQDNGVFPCHDDRSS